MPVIGFYLSNRTGSEETQLFLTTVHTLSRAALQDVLGGLEPGEAVPHPMMPAEGDGGAVGRSGRKSRANAGARLRDILQQEAKDLKVSTGRALVACGLDHSHCPARCLFVPLACCVRH